MNVSEFPQTSPSKDSLDEEEMILRSLEDKSLLELSELYRSSHWKHPKPYSARKNFWVTFSHRLHSNRNEASLTNADGFYPLHLVQKGSSTIPTPDFVIQTLVEIHPQAAAYRDLNGILPYTYIFDDWRQVPDKTIEAILGVDARAGFVIFNKIRKPSILKMIATKHPTMLKEPFHDKSIPLHAAAKLIWFHKDIFDLLLQKGKEVGVGGEKGVGGLFVKDKCGRTPLDCVLYSSFTSKNRKSATQRLSDGKIKKQPVDWDWIWDLLKSSCRQRCGKVSAPPLHSAIELGCSHSIIRLMIEKRSEDVRAVDSRGMTPLAVAASKDIISSPVIDALLHNHTSSYPEASLISDNDGNLPLHLALESSRKDDKKRWDVFQSIVESAPEAIQIPNRLQMYPFMIAAGNDMNSLDTIYVLLRNAPFVIHAHNNK